MKAEEGMFDIDLSMTVIDLHEHHYFPSQLRVQPTHNDQNIPSGLVSNRFCSDLKCSRELIDGTLHRRICKFEVF
jgi:hypothetical protein